MENEPDGHMTCNKQLLPIIPTHEPNKGPPAPVEGNVFIIAAVRGSHLKMVKIAVTGETTFDWIDAKYHDPSATSSCRDQETFSESCFHGSSVSQGNYDIQLVASSGSGKLQYLSST